MTLTELKRGKIWKCTRRDYSYIPDDELIHEGEKFIRKNGWTIVKATRTAESVEYALNDNGKDRYFSVILNPPWNAAELRGEIEFRSKDYVFRYRDHAGNLHQIFGNVCAENIEKNVIHAESFCAKIDYIID